jgi:hypothetical protein
MPPQPRIQFTRVRKKYALEGPPLIFQPRVEVVGIQNAMNDINAGFQVQFIDIVLEAQLNVKTIWVFSEMAVVGTSLLQYCFIDEISINI